MGSLFSKKHRRDTPSVVPPSSSSHEHFGKSQGFIQSEINTHSQSKTLCHEEGGVTSLVYDPYNKCIISGGNDCAIIVSKISENGAKQIVKLTNHTKPVTKLGFSKQLGILSSGSRDKSICLWNNKWEIIGNVPNAHEMLVSGLSFSPDGCQLATGSRDNTVKLWDTNRIDGAQQPLCSQHINRNLVTHICWAKMSHVFAQTSEDKEVRLWDSRNLSVITSFVRKQNIQTCCDLDSDGRFCLTCSHGFSGSGCEVTLWDCRMSSKPISEFYGHSESVQACAMLLRNEISHAAGDLNNFYFLSASNDSQLALWQPQNNQTIQRQMIASFTIPGASALMSLCHWQETPDCHRIAVGSFKSGVHVFNFNVKQNNLMPQFSF